MKIDEFKTIIESHKQYMLTKEKETQLIQQIQNGEDKNGRITEKLIKACMYSTGMYVCKIFYKYKNLNIEPEDLLSPACEGLWKSIDSYDPQFGTTFHNYAMYKMNSCIAETISKEYRIDGKLPNNLQSQLNRLNKVINDWILKNGQEPTDEDIAKEMSIESDEVLFLKGLRAMNISIDDFHNTNVTNDNDDENFNASVYDVEDNNSKQHQSDTSMDFSFLPPLDREIFIRSHGLNGYSAMTHEEILEDLNKIRKEKGKPALTIKDIQIHYNRAAILDRCQD